ncbi:MFS transporter [Duganella sp. sic0402]|uniref:MFS transporter n=1 Tax=Duganella sp. sic0402 TaxID=2854786 RepID=UPI001C479531|nr:MFS transporter [Duganella sp. sic0402]MBV7534963.1 MFS transporter [Duganella sp. sic0402]
MSNAAYGLLGAPLAMAALPLFVQLPAYYATHLGMALGPLGVVLFVARAIDMLQDPLLGHLLDRTPARHRRWMTLGAGVLVLAFAALWLPPSTESGVGLGIWLALMLVVAYGAHSVVNIAYLAWGARMPAVLAAAAWREGLGLAGMIVASLVPAAILAGDPAQVRTRLAVYSMIYVLLMLAAIRALLRRAPPPQSPAPATAGANEAAGALAISGADGGWRDTWRELARNRKLRALLLPYFLNALSVAIPATLALFFIADQLGAPQLSGAFLACYFGAAACGLPAWAALARRYGPLRCWQLGMLLSVAGFCGAALLGHGDLLPYAAVCIAAGVALGADLALPPVLLGQALGERLGAGFGLFTLLGKLSLAIAGLSLPLLSWLDYQPGQGGGQSLVLAYAVLPCLIKLLAMAALRRCISHWSTT